MQSPVRNLNPSSCWPHAAWWSRLKEALRSLQAGRTPRRLQLCESVSLGEKRLIAVVQYDTQKFLVGGSTHSVNLLARLGEGQDFSELLTEWCERQR
ncbi:MAG TPA: flagellar biosynthetic protein FliO [Candidatus Binatia bacterium]|nr:flagellar biosynthetic protein FliO [Candidatus Binatia bacterium]